VRRASARLALGFAIFLALAEVARNWGDWSGWPFWLVDYIAVALLLLGARFSLRGEPRGVAWLSGAWGFTCAMFYGSFFSHLAALEANEGDHGPFAPAHLTVVIGLLFALSVVGFASSLARATGARD
jgi:hypothetical protein